MFRGNYAMLEYLRLGVNMNTMKMLDKERVFENKHSVLRHVVVDESGNYGDFNLASVADVSKLLRKIASSAYSFGLSTSTVARMPIVMELGDYSLENVREFDALASGFSLYNVLCLLKSFPALEKLKGIIYAVGEEFERIDAKDLLEHIVSLYCNVGRNVQVWEGGFSDRISKGKAVDCTILLALACPKLRQIEAGTQSIPYGNSDLNNALQSKSYNKYASQLGWLLEAKLK